MMAILLVPMVAFLVIGAIVSGSDDKAESRRRRESIRKIQLKRNYRPCGSE